MRIFLRISLLMLVATTTGCASFSAQLLPIRSYDEVAPSPTRPISSFDYDISMMLNGDKVGAVTGYEKAITNVFSKAGGFKTIQPGKGTEQYHISFNPGGEVSLTRIGFWAGFSAGTLFLIPTTTTSDYSLEVVLFKDNQEIKRYAYHETTRYWFHISMLFATAHRLRDVDEEIMEQMLLNLLHDMKRDGYA